MQLGEFLYKGVMYELVTGADTPILRKVLEPVESFDEQLKKVLDEMQKTMLHPDPETGVSGVGLAANQVGLDMRVMLVMLNVGTKKDTKVIAMINPEIVKFSSAKVKMEEGCLSLPGEYSKVSRPAKVQVKWQNEKGNWCERKFDGWDARIIQHELDHLNGIMFIDYL